MELYLVHHVLFVSKWSVGLIAHIFVAWLKKNLVVLPKNYSAIFQLLYEVVVEIPQKFDL